MKRTALAFGLGAALALAACTSTHDTTTAAPTTSTTPATVAPASPTTSTTRAGSPPTSAGALTNEASGPTYCPSSQLAASLGSEDGTAGTIYYHLAFRNTGTSSCIERGYPGVSFVAGAGRQIGVPANRQPGSIETITLAPGDSVSAILGITDSSAYGPPCGRTAVLGLRVYPPNQTAALFVPHNDYGCTNPNDVILHIFPLGYTP